MLTPVRSAQFKRDVRRAQRRGKDLAKLRPPLTALIRQTSLPTRYRDHPLRGDWQGYREIHIEPDWLLIYRIEGEELRLVRTGSHADLFRE
ncbi:MAG: type II toxin-antitoxin system YafQ family toxin [Defluviicoccus sp.]|nr:type II toxin-antitoxin system YafQ family toxin [Defluviicoccus sp.]MDE0384430.1 type II toxin-antitoxin system YafQ family toxin [Defluviicoccus sp.]